VQAVETALADRPGWVVREVQRLLHDDVGHVEAWAKKVALEVEREGAEIQARQAILEARSEATLDYLREGDRKAREERECGFQRPDLSADLKRKLEVVV
jgi:hypothetical protein